MYVAYKNGKSNVLNDTVTTIEVLTLVVHTKTFRVQKKVRKSIVVTVRFSSANFK